MSRKLFLHLRLAGLAWSGRHSVSLDGPAHGDPFPRTQADVSLMLSAKGWAQGCLWVSQATRPACT